MSDTDIIASVPVVRAEEVGRRGLFGLGRAKAPKPASPDVHLYLHSLRPDGTRNLRRIVSKDDRPPASERLTALYVATTPQPLEMSLTSAARDSSGAPWDLRLSGSWTVDDSRRFLQRYAADVVTPGAPLSTWRVQSWMAETAADRLHGATAGQSIDSLRALDASHWSGRLNDWFSDAGLVFSIHRAAWTSAEADAAEAEADRQRQLRRVEEARQKRREAEMREAASIADYENQKARIADEQNISEAERTQRLQLVEIEHRRRRIEAEEDVENARRDSERAELEHELALAKLRHDIESVEKAEHLQSDADARHREMMSELAALRQTLQRAAAAPGNLLGLAVTGDTARAHDAVAQLTTLHGIPAEQLAALGVGTAAQSLMNTLRRKAADDGDPVRLKKTDLRTRDIGTVRVRALPVNTSLQFELDTRLPGCVTLLNVGTSGRVFLHAPNAWVSAEAARVAAGLPCPVPGNPLMPWDRLREQGFDYVEIGPPGWEHLAAIVTPHPIVPSAAAGRATPRQPFVELTPGETAALHDRLATLPPKTWSAGLLSFLVE